MASSVMNVKTCHVDGCKNQAQTRGVCKACYVFARSMVSNEVTSWDELVELDLVLPAYGKGGNPLGKKFAEAKAKQAKAAKKPSRQPIKRK